MAEVAPLQEARYVGPSAASAPLNGATSATVSVEPDAAAVPPPEPPPPEPELVLPQADIATASTAAPSAAAGRPSRPRLTKDDDAASAAMPAAFAADRGVGMLIVPSRLRW
jgi:hypothetical protein